MTVSSAPRSPFAVFRKRNFSLLWTGQFVETVGNALTSIAASMYVYRLTGSALSVGLMLMATAAPSLLVGLFAGVIVDRYDRRKIMIAADILRGVLILLVPVLVPLSVIWLYILVLLISAVSRFFDPAYESILPEVATPLAVWETRLRKIGVFKRNRLRTIMIKSAATPASSTSKSGSWNWANEGTEGMPG